MNKIKDRFTLSLFAGVMGGALAMTTDTIASVFNLSRRSWRVTAAGALVSTKRQAESLPGQLLGTLMTLTLSTVGAFGLISALTKYGRDNFIAKGLFFGLAFGNVINSIINGFSHNRISPKDSITHLSYMLSSAAFGVITAFVAAKMGHDSIYDAPPMNDRLNPTEKTTEENLQKLNAAK